MFSMDVQRKRIIKWETIFNKYLNIDRNGEVFDAGLSCSICDPEADNENILPADTIRAVDERWEEDKEQSLSSNMSVNMSGALTGFILNVFSENYGEQNKEEDVTDGINSPHISPHSESASHLDEDLSKNVVDPQKRKGLNQENNQCRASHKSHGNDSLPSNTSVELLHGHPDFSQRSNNIYPKRTKKARMISPVRRQKKVRISPKPSSSGNDRCKSSEAFSNNSELKPLQKFCLTLDSPQTLANRNGKFKSVASPKCAQSSHKNYLPGAMETLSAFPSAQKCQAERLPESPEISSNTSALECYLDKLHLQSPQTPERRKKRLTTSELPRISKRHQLLSCLDTGLSIELKRISPRKIPLHPASPKTRKPLSAEVKLSNELACTQTSNFQQKDLKPEHFSNSENTDCINTLGVDRSPRSKGKIIILDSAVLQREDDSSKGRLNGTKKRSLFLP